MDMNRIFEWQRLGPDGPFTVRMRAGEMTSRDLAESHLDLLTKIDFARSRLAELRGTPEQAEDLSES